MKLLARLTICSLFLTAGYGSLLAQIKTKQEKGFFNITNIAEPQYLQSVDSSNLDHGIAYIKNLGISFSTINGVFLNSGLSIGLGLGLQFTKYNVDESGMLDEDFTPPEDYYTKSHVMTLLPIFADFRYYPSNYRNNMMLLINVGYAPLLNIGEDMDREQLNGGPFVKLGAGYKLELSSSISLLPSLNLNAQRFGDNTAVGGSVGLGLMF